MKSYKAIILDNNKEYTYVSDVPIDMVGLNPKEDHIEITTDDVVESANFKITKLSFLNRFTDLELASFYTAVNSDIGMQILEKKLMAALFIDLKDSMTIYAVSILKSVGIIQTQARVDEILNTAPTEGELYNG